MSSETEDEPPRLLTVADVIRYYEPFRRTQVLNFARYVIAKGYRATVPRKPGQPEETWQACGRRLFGDAFIPAMEQALEEYRASVANDPPDSEPQQGPIPDPEF